ncbi:MAG: hypothetical protein Q8830_02915 [Candidatus Phytoplasma australasiaticum]|nr:hypothetical protein [Candidatus Phytoplasma australasiaticum]
MGVEEEKDTLEQEKDVPEQEEQVQTLEANGHDTENQADEIELRYSDDEAIHFAVSHMTSLETAKWLIVFLRGRWTVLGAKEIFTQGLTNGSKGFQ